MQLLLLGDSERTEPYVCIECFRNESGERCLLLALNLKRTLMALGMIDDNRRPTEVDDDYWVRAFRKFGKYPEKTEQCGKWIVFIDVERIDSLWATIKDAVENGKLGSSAKVATMRPNEREARPGYKVICIYTYDGSDKEDVLRVLQEMRNIGCNQKTYYKLDKTTMMGQYSSNSRGRVSLYWAREGKVELL